MLPSDRSSGVNARPHIAPASPESGPSRPRETHGRRRQTPASSGARCGNRARLVGRWDAPGARVRPGVLSAHGHEGSGRDTGRGCRSRSGSRASWRADVGEPADQVRPAVERVIRLALDEDAVADAAMLVEADSEGAARDGLLPEQLIDRYLSTLWAIWEVRAPATRSGRSSSPSATGCCGPRMRSSPRSLSAIARSSGS